MAALRDPLIGPPGAVLLIAPQPGEATAFLSRETGRSPDESRCPAPVSKDGGIAEQAGQKINRIFLPKSLAHEGCADIKFLPTG